MTAKLINPTFTGDRQQFFKALLATLSDSVDLEDQRNILPIVYEILADKLAETDRLVSASKNDNYTSITINDELIVRSKDVSDKLIYESAFQIDRIGITSSTDIFTETQRLRAGTTSIILKRVPSDFTDIQITQVGASSGTSTVDAITFDEFTNTVTIPPLTVSTLYSISYATTGDLFRNTEEKTFGSLPDTQIPLEHDRILYNSEKIFPRNEATFVRDEDYVINYKDGIIDFLNVSVIANKEVVFEYDYQRDLLNDVTLNSHVPVVNEIAIPNLDDPFLVTVRNSPIQDVTLIQNITTEETYTATGISENQIRFTGITSPARTTAEEDIVILGKTLDFVRERDSIRGEIIYPENVMPLNHPIVSLDEFSSETKSIKLSAANQIITGRDATVYRRIKQEEAFIANAESVVLDFEPVNFSEVQIYFASDLTETNLITPLSFNPITREFLFTGITTAGNYVVKYDTLQWIVYIAQDVTDITIKTGGVLLRNAFRKLLPDIDYTVTKDDLTTMRITFTDSGVNRVRNTSTFYTLTRIFSSYEDPELVNDEKYEFAYHEYLKNELVAFTIDPLDLISLIKLERFRDRGQTADVITNPVVRVFSLDGETEYIENIDFEINYITKTIKRVDGAAISPSEVVKVFYRDEETATAGFTYVQDVIQIDYEYGDNTVNHSPTIVDTSVVQLEALQAGAVQILLDYYPADWEQIKITNTVYPDRVPIKPVSFDPSIKRLRFPALPVDGTYQFKYDKREQVINEGTPYYVTYRYGARRDALQDYFAYLLNLDIGSILREDEFLLASNQATQILDYKPVDYTRVKIYEKYDQSKTPVTIVRDYNFITNTLVFDPVEDAGAYVFEYYTFSRVVEQLRKGIIGLTKGIPQVPRDQAFVSLIREFTATDPEIDDISDNRFKIGRKICLTADALPGDTFLSITSVERIPASGTAIIYDQTLEEITYSFTTSGKLQGIPPLGFGSITESHSSGTKIIIVDDPNTSYRLNPALAKEAPDLPNGSRAIQFVTSKFGTALLTQSSRHSWVKYKAVDNVFIEEGTLSFWTGTRYNGDDRDTHYYVDIGRGSPYKNRLSLYKSNRGYLNFDIRDGNNRLMSIRADVRRSVEEELLTLTIGQTEVELAKIPSFSIADENGNGVSELFESPETKFIFGLSNGQGGIIPGTQVKVLRWDREKNRLIIDPITAAGTYFLSYIIGFVDFDEDEHFIEIAWKTHVRDGLPPRMKMFIDGQKYERNIL